MARLQNNIERIRNVDETTKTACFGTLYHLAERILKLGDSHTRHGSARWDLLEDELGREIAKAARDGLMRSWRLYEPPLRSEAEHTQTTYGTIAGLVGLAIEACERPDWANRLSKRDASLACRYAMHEMNGLPDWAPDLMAAHPEAFDDAMHAELTWEFELPIEGPQPHHMIPTLRYGPEPIRERYRPFVQKLLQRCEPAHAQTLEDALTLLLGWNGLERAEFAGLVRQRHQGSQDEGRRLTWLVAWMCVDAGNALLALRAWLDEAEDLAEADRRMIAFCNALMDHRDMRFGTTWRDFERLEVLRELVPLVYRHVRIDEDRIHEGPYSPDTGDNAESTRGYLLGRVAQTPGHMAFDALMAFSEELPNERSRDRMTVLARQRAAEDAEHEPWTAQDVVIFASEAERDPRSARDLFELVCARLDDLKLDLEEGDASEARILRGVGDEETLRTWFANRLRLRARGRYSVPPEEELADETRPDLRVHAPAVDAPVGIELKIADNWSYSQLVERLQSQLVGQYLRDVRSRFGIFLLVWRGRERWRDPKSGQIICFDALIKQLRAEADVILRSRRDVDGIGVVGIDLTRRDLRP